MPTPTPKQTQRRLLRQQRAALAPQQQQQCARAMAQHLRRQSVWRNARHIALYLPVRGEADPRVIRRYALPRQQFYLPVLSPFRRDKRLWFICWNAQTRFRLNRFRIPEPLPRYRQRRSARWLDLVVTPLVAFDHSGTRMGMGGGFYDRTFAFKHNTTLHASRPHLVGLAYDFQRIDKLERQSWDVPLDALVSETQFFHF
jgi:5-formyltetrahydrofolate cyclo-ligase